MLLSQIIQISELKIEKSSIINNEDIYLASKEVSAHKHILTIITEEEIIKLNPKSGNYFVLGSKGEFNSLESINYILSSLDDISEVCKSIQEIILKDQSFFEKVYSCIYLDKGLESLLNVIAEEFSDKVCILDNNKKLLYNPFNFNKVSQLFPLKYISSNSSRLFSYLSFENNQDEEKEKINKLSTIISNYVFKEVKKLQTSYDNFYKSIKALVNGEFSDEDFKVLKGLNWNINDNYDVYIVKLESGLFKYRDMFVHGNRFILDNPQYLFSILNGNHLILLLNKSRLNKSRLDEEIVGYFDKYKLKYYCHNLKNNLLNMRKVYDLGKYIFEKDVPIIYKGQDNLGLLFETTIRDIDFLEILVPDELKPLLEHDLEKNSEFLKTLYLYLLEERSLIKVAEIMDIHRNSVVYRINRISELVDMDFEDSKLRYNLILGLEILRQLYPQLINL